MKQKEKEKFKEIPKRKEIKNNQLLNSQTLGKEPYLRLESLIQLSQRTKWWKSKSQKEKSIVIKDLKIYI